jgi:hypothetical protein
MSSRQGTRICLFCCMLGAFCYPLATFTQSPPATVQSVIPERNGQHDFDFNIGTWKTRIMYLEHPLTGSTSWQELDGTVVVQKIWDGRGQIEKFSRDDSPTQFETLLLRVYDPRSHEWSFIFANSAGSVLCAHMTGEFKDGQGEFIDREPFNGKIILARTRWTEITANSLRYEIAFSDDEGKTWEPNFIAARIREKQ